MPICRATGRAEMRKARPVRFRVIPVAAVALSNFAICLLVVPSLIPEPVGGALNGGDMPLTKEQEHIRIPGIMYPLAEVECRTWHRNRGSRPFDFLLKQ